MRWKKTTSAVIVVVMVLGLVSYPILHFKWFVSSFPRRHVEVTRFVEAVYAHFSKTGQWPDEQQARQLAPLPVGWSYREHADTSDAQSTPVLSLQGDYHSSLVYRFAPPVDKQIENKWRMGIEGDQSDFNADAPYRIGA